MVTPTPTPVPRAETDEERLKRMQEELFGPRTTPTSGPSPTPTPSPTEAQQQQIQELFGDTSAASGSRLPDIVPEPAEPRRGKLEAILPGFLGPAARFGQGVIGSVSRVGSQQEPLFEPPLRNILRRPENRADELIRNAGFDPQEVRRNPGQRFTAPGDIQTVGIPISGNRTEVRGTGREILAAAERVAREEPRPQEATAGRVVGSLATLGVGEEPLRPGELGGPLETAALAFPPVGGPAIGAAAGAARNIARGRVPRLPRLPARGPQREPVRLQVPKGQAPPPGFAAEAAPPARAAPAAAEPVAARVAPAAEAATGAAPSRIPEGVEIALAKAAQLRQIDAPGFFGRFLDRIPGIKQAQRYLRPANAIPEDMQAAYVAEAGERARLSPDMFRTRTKLFADMDTTFGPGSSTGARTTARYIGPAEQSTAIEGTMLDVAQRPHLYELSAAQSEFLGSWQGRNSRLMQQLIEDYGADVAEFPARPGGVFLSNVDIADDVLQALESSRFRVALKGRGKTRVFEDASTRMLKDPKFRPETNIRNLQTAMDEWKAGVAGSEIFKRGIGGKTLVQVIDELHPNLRQVKEKLAAQIKSLRARIVTAESQGGQAALGAKQAGVAARQAERRAKPLRERIEALQAQKARKQAERPLDRALRRDTGEIDEEIDRLTQALLETEAEIEAFAVGRPIRPPWAVGLSDEEVMAVARHEGLNPYAADWFDAIDSTVISEARRGFFKGTGPTITEMRGGRAELRAQLKEAQASQAERRAEPMLERIEELGAEYGPELSYLSGQVRELLRAAKLAERRGVKLTLRAVGKREKARTLTTELNSIAPQLRQVQRRYAAANKGGNQLVQEGIFRYFPAAEAKAVRELRSISTNTIAKLLDEARGTAFAGDFSPILGIQLPVGALFNPKMAVQRLIGAARASRGDIFHIFRSKTLAQAVTEDVTGWQEFAFWSGIPVKAGPPTETFAEGLLRVRGGLGRIPGLSRLGGPARGARPAAGVPQEFAGGLLRFLPGFSRANEAMYTVVLRQSKALYDKQLAILANAGVTGDTANMIAADMATKIYPMWNPRRLGLSSARAAALRSVPTSISFVLRPAAFIGEASTGFAKLAMRQPLAPQQQLAVRLAITAAATTMTMSITSAVASALARGKDPWQAALEVTDPTSGKFASVVFGTRRLPLGGPFRGMIKAIVPRDVDWAPVPVPFANIGNFIINRMNPGAKTQFDILRNRDFFGTTILKGKMPEQILRSLLFEIEGLAPLTAGAVIEGVRRDLPIGEIAEETAAQFVGTNLGRETPGQERALARDQLAASAGLQTLAGTSVREWSDMNRAQQKQAERENPEIQKLSEEVDRQIYRRSDLQTQARLDVQRDERTKFEASMVQVAEQLVGKVRGTSKKWYDDERSRIRAEHRGATGVLWDLRVANEGVKDLEKWIRDNQRPEDAALDAYFERRVELLADIPVLSSLEWNRVERELKSWLITTYGQEIAQYVVEHKNDWVLDLPDIAQRVEIYRASAIERGAWWQRYSDWPAAIPVRPVPAQAPNDLLPVPTFNFDVQ